METNRERYGVNLTALTRENLVKYIVAKEAQLQEVETHLEIAWQQLRSLGE